MNRGFKKSREMEEVKSCASSQKMEKRSYLGKLTGEDGAARRKVRHEKEVSEEGGMVD